MALTRAMSLSEVTLARMAAAWFVEPETVVFVNGKVWSRGWEEMFYGTMLVTPFVTSSDGFGALRDLRDLYVHGYGIPATRDDDSRSRRSSTRHSATQSQPTKSKRSGIAEPRITSVSTPNTRLRLEASPARRGTAETRTSARYPHTVRSLGFVFTSLPHTPL